MLDIKIWILYTIKVKRKSAYLFLGWYLTINELVVNEEINKEAFHHFIAALNSLQQELNCKINLIVLSGTSQKTAMKVYKILDKAFKDEQSAMLSGFAFEYGGLFIDKNGVIKKLYSKTTTLGNIDEICKKHNIYVSKDYKLYYSFQFKRIGKKELNFIEECKNVYADKDFEFINDKYGKGFDIKNKDLNKHEFVTKYLKNTKADLLIFGGDSVQDKIMFEKSDFQNKYFLGFKAYADDKPNYILSSKENIWGIIDDLNALSARLKAAKETAC